MSTTVAPRRLITRVVGVSFADGYPDNLHRLAEAAEQSLWLDHAWLLAEPLTAVLLADPANEHDPNAVEVHVPALGGRVGFLTRGLARHVAPRLSTDRLTAGVIAVLIHPDHPERPGLLIEIRGGSDVD